mmetsp:Transcript_5059/g.12077  ORF Transcript_5059/g.12077 Transcript_5059/m.12077 type:complete len:481 (+) Transcript_5059:277-1719(+)
MGDEADKAKDDWWRTADLGECPITLECFSTLGYPPFALYHPGKIPTTANGRNEGISAYFDGLALASYIVSRGVFQNPLTRAELTAEDCRRLDRYLQAHCYSGDAASSATIFRGSRVISVAEAFCLRNSVSVETTTASQSNNERDRERIRTLQNAATAALAGLFVYGNDRSRFENNDEITQSVPRFRSGTDALLNDWGFDLSRQVEDISAQGTHGYSVIDDDEAVEVASRRHAYESVQEAFPPLRDNDGTARGSAMVSPDEELMERVRTMSARDEKEERRHSLQLELARAQLLRQALERRKQRQNDRADRLARGAKTYASQKKDKEELERARKEIEAWRDDQWEKLRLLSEQQQGKQKEMQNSSSKNQNGNPHKDTDGGDKKTKAVVDDAETDIHDTEERKKAKAAAKRKRAKERKKAKKALEKEEAEKIRLKEAEKAQRAASALKCAACGTGILKPSLAFERFDQLFCTPKCARTAVKPG